jgi:hypothetical protein
MIKHLNIQKLSGLYYCSGYGYIIWAWSAISAWVIVSNDDAGCVLDDSYSEDLAYSDLGRV